MFILRKLERGVWTGLKILARLAVLLFIPVFCMSVNLVVDRDGYFQGERYEREIALSLLEGNNMVDYQDMDERSIMALYVQNLQEPLDTVALGSSRIMQMNREYAGTESFYNCGMSGADFRDMLGTFYLFDKADKLPKNLILGLDPWLLSSEEDAWSERSDADLYEEFITEKLGVDTGYVAPNDTSKYYQLFNPLYFRDNLAYYFVDSKTEVLPKVVEGDLQRQDSEVKMADGSVLYSYSLRQEGIDKIEERARAEAGTFLRMEGYIAPDPELCDIFDRFVQYAKNRGVNVIFVLAPYHPIVYTYASEWKHMYPGFFLTEPWFTNYAKNNDIPLYGSYNPYVADLNDDEFYDGLHIRGEAYSNFFPGMPEVANQQKNGQAGSRWFFSGPRVSYTTAEKWVAKRYEIELPEVLKQGEDEIIDGQTCYVLERYAGGSGNAVMRARYAVGQDEGNIFRYDTTVNAWVPLLLFS